MQSNKAFNVLAVSSYFAQVSFLLKENVLARQIKKRIDTQTNTLILSETVMEKKQTHLSLKHTAVIDQQNKVCMIYLVY